MNRQVAIRATNSEPSGVPVLVVHLPGVMMTPGLDRLATATTVVKFHLARHATSLYTQQLMQDHRPGSFEVVLHKGDVEIEVWSKLLTGTKGIGRMADTSITF